MPEVAEEVEEVEEVGVVDLCQPRAMDPGLVANLKCVARVKGVRNLCVKLFADETKL